MAVKLLSFKFVFPLSPSVSVSPFSLHGHFACASFFLCGLHPLTVRVIVILFDDEEHKLSTKSSALSERRREVMVV